MKKLNPFWHMLSMGVQLGLSLGSLYALLVYIIAIADANWLQIDWATVFGYAIPVVLFGIWIGATAGMILGVLGGFFLSFMTTKAQNPFAMLEKKRISQIGIAILTTLGGFLILFVMVLGDIRGFYSLFGIPALLPPFIAGAAAVYATNRYFAELSPYDTQKEKRKNDDLRQDNRED